VKNPRHNLCPTSENPDRRRLIVRNGELLIGMSPEGLAELEPEEVEELRAEEVECGEGIEKREGRPEWCARVPGFGYLDVDERGVPSVVPAITASEDRLAAFLELRHPTGDEPALRLTEIYGAIRESGIVHGYSAENTQKAWKRFQRCAVPPPPVHIASGTLPRIGAEGGIEWAVDVARQVGMVHSTCGRIDFREQQYVSNVRAGQRLGIKRSEVASVSGVGVDGSEILPEADVPAFQPKLGDNIVLVEVEDGSVAVEAAVDGVLIFDEQEVARVSEVLEVEGDVDFETGNIRATASVVVQGAIREEFRVTTSHDLTVRGVVEAAELDVGGNLVAEGGIVGDDETDVVVAGDATARYCQNARIRCAGDVTLLDSDVSSSIDCAGSLRAVDGRGHLRGGVYSAGMEITARELGSELGAPTHVTVGTDGEAEKARSRVRTALRNVRAQMRLTRRLEPPFSRKMTGADRKASQRRRQKVARELGRKEASLRARLVVMEKECAGSPDSRVTVLNRVHHGVEIVVNGRHLRVKGTTTGRRFVHDRETNEVDAQLL